MTRDSLSLQNFLINVADVEYTEEECDYIIDNKLLNSWLI